MPSQLGTAPSRPVCWTAAGSTVGCCTLPCSVTLTGVTSTLRGVQCAQNSMQCGLFCTPVEHTMCCMIYNICSMCATHSVAIAHQDCHMLRLQHEYVKPEGHVHVPPDKALTGKVRLATVASKCRLCPGPRVLAYIQW